MTDKNIPEIRFKGFTEAWEQRKVKDIAQETFGGGTPNTRIEKYWNGAFPWIQSSDLKLNDLNEVIPTKFITKEAIENSATKIVPKNSIAIVTRVGVGKLAFIQYSYSTSQDFLSLSLLNTDVFFALYSLYRILQKEIKNIQGTSIKGITKSDLLSKNINLSPIASEQIKIGSFMKKIDEYITLHQRKLETLKKLKKSLLQKLFPRKDENIPELRFSGFTEAWEQRKFGEIAEYKKGPFGSALKKSLFVPKSKETVKIYEQQNAINKDWKLERYYISNEYAQKLKGFEVLTGDYIVSCAGTIGEIYEIPEDAEYGIINQALMRIRVNEKSVEKELFSILFSNMIEKFTTVHSNGSAIKNIPPLSDLKPFSTQVPAKKEQKLIVLFMREVNNLITLHQNKLETLKELKRTLLNKMFV